jgi:hypothetical protein
MVLQSNFDKREGKKDAQSFRLQNSPAERCHTLACETSQNAQETSRLKVSPAYQGCPAYQSSTEP